MPSKSKQKSKPTNIYDKTHPFVSICTPTFNRRPFIKTMIECFKNQDYPKHRMEWIIVDDGTDKIKDLIDAANIPQIRYFQLDQKLPLGAKRNYMHKQVNGSIIVYMDDDDYYPPERVSHAVERLQNNESALCAGSSEIYLYFKTIGKMIQAGPYGPNHATAGTFAFKRKMLYDTQYEDNAALAEEKAFLKNYTVPFVQLDPLKTILVFSHEHNTFDKREMLKNGYNQYFNESPKTVDMFIRKPQEDSIKKFFMNDIDALLEEYEPGLPKMKPDVLKQMEEIKKKREEMSKQHAAQNPNAPIVLQQPGQLPVSLTSTQVVNLIKQLQEANQKLTDENKQLQQGSNEPSNGPIVLQQPGRPPILVTPQQLVEQNKQLQESNKTITLENNNLQQECSRLLQVIQNMVPDATESIQLEVSPITATPNQLIPDICVTNQV